MNVGQLISLLQQAPSDREVRTEGCDCTGDVFAVMVEADKVTILREEGALTPSERKAAQAIFALPASGIRQ